MRCKAKKIPNSIKYFAVIQNVMAKNILSKITANPEPRKERNDRANLVSWNFSLVYSLSLTLC